jgi:dTDP-4-amino-4,6-dideoxygalactose transaminase
LLLIDDRPEGVILMSTTLPAGSSDLRSAGGYGDVEDVPLARPGVPDPSAVAQDVERILKSGVLTNGPYVRQLELRAAEYLDVRECVAVASCTAGLMLLLRAAELTGDVVIPSFTFAATAHAVAWNGLQPVFADVDPSTLTLSPEAVRRAMGVRTSAILATHIFGTPCEVELLEDLAARDGIRLFFDAAHAFGSLRSGVPIGRFGNGEVFSLSPTKVLVAGEGGIIATNDETLAERCRIGRDYGNPGDYDCRFVGLNARMSEVHAAIALNSFEGLEDRIEKRNTLVQSYMEALAHVEGISFLQIGQGDRSTYKDFTVLVDPQAFGLDADALGEGLAAVGIETRRYYSPPVHTMRAYRRIGSNADLPVTDAMAAQTLTLPLWVEMTEAHVARVADAIGRIRRYVRNRTS